MRMYKCYDDSGIEELGNYDEKIFRSLLAKAAESVGEEDFIIGVYKSDEDFIEICPVGDDGYLLWSDRLHKSGSFFSRLFQEAKIQKIIDGENQIMKIVQDYTISSRKDFELEHS